MSSIAHPVSRSQSSMLDAITLQYEIEQFLYLEAALLDERRFHEWYELLADDLEYWMPVRTTRLRGDDDKEFAGIGEGAFFDEDKNYIAERIRKLDTGFAWAEDPPSRTRHFVNNIRILERPSPEEWRIGCNFLIYRTRLADEEDTWIGRREDSLRRVENGFQIFKRHIFIDQVSLSSKNLSIFF